MTGYDVGDVVLYIIKRLGGSVDGVKKLMKLVFLVQYGTPRLRFGRKVVEKYLYRGEPITRAEFYIWSYGPLSNEVYDVVDSLEVDDSQVPVRIFAPRNVRTVNLPEPVRKRIDEVVERYGRCQGWELERRVLKMLDLDECKKSEFMGVPVDDYLRITFGGRFREKELSRKIRA